MLEPDETQRSRALTKRSEELTMIATLRPLTYDDLQDMPDDGQRYEILGGELIVTPAPTAAHQRVLRSLDRLIDDHVRRTGVGELFGAPFDVLLSRFDTVEPDLVFVSAARPPVANDQNSIDFPPDLVVEVISPSSRRYDRVRKMALYSQSGVREYWIADPERRTLEIYALEGEAYVQVDSDAAGRLNSRVLPGLQVDPSEIFAVLG
jgi:Uma2 family endonuclease